MLSEKAGCTSMFTDNSITNNHKKMEKNIKILQRFTRFFFFFQTWIATLIRNTQYIFTFKVSIYIRRR